VVYIRFYIRFYIRSDVVRLESRVESLARRKVDPMSAKRAQFIALYYTDIEFIAKALLAPIDTESSI
jgi:hypothetical protein